jgi:hypothetical protein
LFLHSYAAYTGSSAAGGAKQPTRKTKPVTAPRSTDIIEGSYRVVSTRVVTARRSPNRDRLVARIALWNGALLMAAVFLPQLLG